MKKLAFALLFLPSFAVAESIPPGCYVADYYRLDPCWNSFDGFYSWVTNTSTAGAPTLYYGETVAALIKSDTIANNELSACHVNFNNLYNACESAGTAQINQYNELVGKYNGLLDTSANATKKSASLVKKLRKACGNACKKIK